MQDTYKPKSQSGKSMQEAGSVIDPVRKPTADALNSVGLGAVGDVLMTVDPGHIGDMLFGGIENTFQPGYAAITPGFSQEQLNTSYNQSQAGLEAQRNLYTSLAGQNGINNQSDILSQQQGLANQLQAQSMGYGPNPALAQLAQQTQANTANQAALMAGQRGASQNAGLMARQTSMMGANNQQQMVGQAATMQAQQQIAAQQQLAQQQQSMQGVAGQQVQNLANANNAYNSLAQNQHQMLLNANSAYNNASVGMQSNVNNVGSAVSMANQNANKGMLGGLMGAAGAAFGLAKGGMVPGYASGGIIDGSQSSLAHLLDAGQAQSNQLANSGIQSAPALGIPYDKSDDQLQKGMAGLGSGIFGKSEKSSGGISSILGGMFASHGAFVPGKAAVAGDSAKNDTVPARLSPGEIVIPRSIVNSKNAPEQAAKFVAAILAKKGPR